MEPALPEEIGPGTGSDGLIPAPPSSLAPSGIPTRPTVDGELRGDAGAPVVAQEGDALAESPPPSNRAPGNPALAGPEQLLMPMPCDGLTGDTPGVAISVDPSGMPTGRVDPKGSGDVPRMPTDGCISGNAA